MLPLGEGVAGVVGVVLAPAPSTEQPPLSGVQLDSHVGAPLHVVWQPVVQPVVLHDCAPLHVCWHLLPEHATELCPVPLELSEHPPPGQSRVTEVAFVDDTEQPPPGHENEQFPPVHANEHCLPSPPQVFAQSAHEQAAPATHSVSTGIAAIQSLMSLTPALSITRLGSSGILISGSSEFMRKMMMLSSGWPGTMSCGCPPAPGPAALPRAFSFSAARLRP